MLAQSKAFSGFAVDDLEQARDFYADTLGLDVKADRRSRACSTSGSPATATSSSIPKATSSPPPTRSSTSRSTTSRPPSTASPSRGVAFERYDGMEQDEKGISHGPGPEIAWFKDPAGNILAVLES